MTPGFRIVRYEGTKVIGLSKWAESQEQLAQVYDLWSNRFKWQVVVLDENQISEVLKAQHG